MQHIANSWVAHLGVYKPGQPVEELARELGLQDASGIAKLASNENPLGPSPKAVAAVRAAADMMHFYPDGGAFYLRRALARHLDLDPEQLLVANGSNEVIEFIGHVFMGPGVDVVVADMAFAIYRLITDMFCAQPVLVPMRDYTHDLPAMLQAITPATRVVFIANPNNPTGTMVAPAELDRFMDALPPHVVACIDEAYIDLMPPDTRPDCLRYVREGRNVILLRTFSKSHGLAGFRIGYAVAPQQGIALLNKVRQPFNVGIPSMVAAMAALEDHEHVGRFQELIKSELPFMEQGLRRLGLAYVPSVANFLMVDVGDGEAVFHELQRELVIVRPLTGYGLPRHVRISLGTRAENERCLEALGRVLARKA
ncbi:MAG: histidinol-phosphate transaminase [Kiritimatiellia bacterium]|nr:histidinol-phosphate transaminase [Lentisphaerota bacterium]